jgi:hypothetical protein
MEMEVHRDLGKHDAQIEALQAQVDRLHGDMASVLDQLTKINRTLAEARGGWKTLLAIAGFSSAITAVAMKIVAFLSTLPGPR